MALTRGTQHKISIGTIAPPWRKRYDPWYRCLLKNDHIHCYTHDYRVLALGFRNAESGGVTMTD